MKLAEALCVRADLQKRIQQIEGRLKSVVKIQEGDEPDENAEDLFSELQQATKQLEDIVYRINQTNLHAMRDGVSITRMIAKRDALDWEISILRNVLKEASQNEYRYGRNEIKYVKTVDVKNFRKKVDSLSADLRRTDLKIQETNWMVELEPSEE